jgi:hypothetical protein
MGILSSRAATGKLTNSIQRIKQHNRNEFDLRTDLASKKAADQAVEYS